MPIAIPPPVWYVSHRILVQRGEHTSTFGTMQHSRIRSHIRIGTRAIFFSNKSLKKLWSFTLDHIDANACLLRKLRI
jgi:hypothetical protein